MSEVTEKKIPSRELLPGGYAGEGELIILLQGYAEYHPHLSWTR